MTFCSVWSEVLVDLKVREIGSCLLFADVDSIWTSKKNSGVIRFSFMSMCKNLSMVLLLDQLCKGFVLMSCFSFVFLSIRVQETEDLNIAKSLLANL